VNEKRKRCSKRIAATEWLLAHGLGLGLAEKRMSPVVNFDDIGQFWDEMLEILNLMSDQVDALSRNLERAKNTAHESEKSLKTRIMDLIDRIEARVRPRKPGASRARLGRGRSKAAITRDQRGCPLPPKAVDNRLEREADEGIAAPMVAPTSKGGATYFFEANDLKLPARLADLMSLLAAPGQDTPDPAAPDAHLISWKSAENLAAGMQELREKKWTKRTKRKGSAYTPGDIWKQIHCLRTEMRKARINHHYVQTHTGVARLAVLRTGPMDGARGEDGSLPSNTSNVSPGVRLPPAAGEECQPPTKRNGDESR